MILGVYSDLHSNLPAMESMLEAVGDVDQWISLGDSVGLFPSVNEVLDKQREGGVIAVRGDHENQLLSGEAIKGSFTGTQALVRQRQVITPSNRNYLSGLAESRDVELGGLKMHLTHYLLPTQKVDEHKYQFDLAQLDQHYSGYDFIFYGHTHLPAIIYCKNAVVINPGSAGFPVDTIRQPSMLRLDTVRRTFELIRYTFDASQLAAVIRAEGYNSKLIQYLSNGNQWS